MHNNLSDQFKDLYLSAYQLLEELVGILESTFI